MYNLSVGFIKSLAKEMLRHEQFHMEKNSDMAPFVAPIGKVIYSCPLGVGTMSVYSARHEKDTFISFASMVEFADGKKGILLSEEFLYDVIFIEAFQQTLMSVVAHELAHYLAGHLDLSDTEEINLKHLDRNTSRQDNWFREGDQDKYMQATVFGLIKGGCVKAELEADLIAVKFVGLNNVISSHLYDLDQYENLAAGIEKYNRILRLIKMTKDEEIKVSDDYELEIRFDNLKKYEED